MADLTITAASVVPGTNARFKRGTAGESITQGQPVYLKASDSRYWLAQNDGTSAEADAKGIATNAAAAGQEVKIQVGGLITIGATVAVGKTYDVSAAYGAICPDADVGSGKYKKVLGVGYSTTQIEMLIGNTPALTP